MTLFSSSRFLCCSMLSFGVSTTWLKNSLLFNMSPKSAIIFIKCRNRYHMKNNIRYKGNFNNTSVIIFVIGRQKLPAMLLCLGEPLVRFLWCWLLFLFFILLLFFISYCCCSSFLLLFIIHCFSTSSLTRPWTIAGFLQPFYTFSPAHRKVTRDTFILTFSRSSFTVLPGVLLFWVGIFYPQALSWGPAFLPWSL